MTASGADSDPLDPIEAMLRLVCEHTPESQWDGAIAALCAQHPAEAEAIRRRFLLMHDMAAIQPPATAPATMAGYRLLRRLGMGGMGVVHLARQESTGREVVLKLIRPEFLGSEHARERFRREVSLASSLDHPGICTIYEAGEVDGSPFLVMRHVPGETLAARIQGQRSTAAGKGSEARSSVTAAIELVETLARALHVAHEAGLVHRDVKPANVMVQPDGQPVLLDFGLARAVESEVHLTMTGEVVGTPAYMSPEQIAGRGDMDRRSDVYALGVTLYELLTGKLPFAAPTRDQLYRQILDGHAEPASRTNRAVSRDLETVLATAMEREAGRRYATAFEFAEDLRRVRRLEPIAARPAGRLLRLRRWSQRNPVAATLTTTLAAALVASTWLLVRGDLALAQSRTRQLVLESRRLGGNDRKLALYVAREARQRCGRDDEALDEETLSTLAEAVAGDSERARFSLPPDINNAWRACFGADGETIWFIGKQAEGRMVDQVVHWRLGEDPLAVHLGGVVFDIDVRPGSVDLAVACPDQGIFLVDAGGTVSRPIDKAPPGVVRLRFLDRDRLLVGTRDGHVEVVDLAGGDGVAVARSEKGISAIAVSPGYKRAGVASRNGDIFLVDADGLAVRKNNIPKQVDRIWLLDDGPTVVRCRDWTLRVFDSEVRPMVMPGDDGTESLVVGGARDPLNMCQLSTTALITGHADQHVRIRSFDGKHTDTLGEQTAWVFELDLSRDGRLLAAGAGDGGITVWDLAGRRLLQRFHDLEMPSLVRFFPAGDRLLVASSRGRIRVLQLKDPWLPDCTEPRTAVRVCAPWPGADDLGFVSVDALGVMASWNKEAALLRSCADNPGQLDRFVVAADGLFAAAFCRSDLSLRLFDRDLHCIAPVVKWHGTTSDPFMLAIGRECILAAGTFESAEATGTPTSDRAWRMRRWAGQGVLEELPPPDGLPPASMSWGLQFSPHGEELLAGCDDGSARLLKWSQAAVTELACLQHGEGKLIVEALAFSADGQLLLTGAGDGTVRMWRHDGSPVEARFVGQKVPILKVGFLQDGGRVTGVMALTSDRLQVWEPDGRRRLAFAPEVGRFTDFAVLPDGRRVAIGSTAARIVVRPLVAEDIADKADQQLRGFEPDNLPQSVRVLLDER